MHDKTMTFSVHDDRENEMKEILTTVYDALKQKGYNRSEEHTSELQSH